MGEKGKFKDDQRIYKMETLVNDTINDDILMCTLDDADKCMISWKMMTSEASYGAVHQCKSLKGLFEQPYGFEHNHVLITNEFNHGFFFDIIGYFLHFHNNPVCFCSHEVAKNDIAMIPKMLLNYQIDFFSCFFNFKSYNEVEKLPTINFRL